MRRHQGARAGAMTRGFPSWSAAAIWALAWLVVAPVGARAGQAPGAMAIGIEGRAVVELPGALYQAKPLDDRTELILRIERIEPAGEGRSRYHLHFIGLEPGSYRLADYLIRPDGSRPDEIGDVRLQVEAMLPEDHNGQLTAHVPRPFPFIGGYRALLVVLAVVWVGGFFAFALAGRKRRRPVPAAAVAPEPTFAERLRPLVEAASTGQLSVDEQAQLERLLMGYWRDRLALPEGRMAEALARLKHHNEAGAILRAVERWLHQPGLPGATEIKTLLQPYRTLPAPGAAAIGSIRTAGGTSGLAGVSGGGGA